MMVKETLNIIKDFYSMRKKVISDYLLINLFPALIGIIAFIVGIAAHKIWDIDILSFTVDFINQTITVLALFISFSIAYVGMLISSDGEVVRKMRDKDSTRYELDGQKIKVYQVTHCMMTYTILVEVLFIIFVFAEKFFVYVLPGIVLKIILCIDVTMIMHITLLIGIGIRDIYYAFWK